MTQKLLAGTAILALALPAPGAFAQSGAKGMFYSPGDLQYARVGIHYWFEDAKGIAVSESRAATIGGSFRLHIRGNVGAFLSVWDVTAGSQLTPMTDGWAGHQLQAWAEYVVPGQMPFTEAGSARRLVVVFGRSQTEQARNAASSLDRLKDLTSRVGRDGLPMIIRETDDSTLGQIGTYVVSREGMPLAAEIVLRSLR